ncbi:hypothetical protein [Pseudomonas phenolilytica]|uniref:hypothetical protein n=1 Tax=Pseudomonas phenolilytica TaxID=2746321 RepID=UPI001F2DFA9E|nr:hypothetical protein [Pseudomonas phenolilytica]UIP85005.1 hypothetical protein HU825_00065 [Pseudomonas phenolilytica]UIP88460.1 hypothetical protein HU825_18685 [Pseudomonas phenolilytica]
MFGLKLLSEPQEPTLEDQLEEAHALADSLRSEIEAATNDSTAAKRPISGMHDDLRATEGEIDRLGREIVKRDDLLNWKAARDSADADIKAAKKEMDAAGKALAALDADYEKASAKLTKLQAAADAELAEAKHSESQAAEAYAAAMAQGSESEEAAALDTLNGRSEALEQVQRKTARQAVILQALQSQVDSIEQKRAAERQRFESARERRLLAVRHKLGARWDAMASEMSELAAQIVAVDWAISRNSRAMDDLHIPVTAKDGGAPITARKVRDSSGAIDVDALRP